MNKELKNLLVAVHNYLEWKVRPEGFVREPIYNLAKSYRDYLGSLTELPYSSSISDFDYLWEARLKELSKQYFDLT